MLSNLFNTLSSLIGDSIERNLQSSNLGSCLTILPENADTILGAKNFVNVKSVAVLIPFAVLFTTGATASLDPI